MTGEKITANSCNPGFPRLEKNFKSFFLGFVGRDTTVLSQVFVHCIFLYADFITYDLLYFICIQYIQI